MATKSLNKILRVESAQASDVVFSSPSAGNPSAEDIAEFQGEFRYLSNFWACPVEFEGVVYPSAENAYQASKCKNQEDRAQFLNITAAAAKQLGKTVELRNDWDAVKLHNMRLIVRDKFARNADLAASLKDTADARLIEGNNWRDTYWGVDQRTGIGDNHLGRILMETRSELLNERQQVQATGIRSYYEGDILPEENVVFVFGSNPEGRHGAGAAKVAVNSFGAVYGQGEGLMMRRDGKAACYALPTKDLRVRKNNAMRSISADDIVDNIRRMYDCARENTDKQFLVAYRNTEEASLNGYTGNEMIQMFISAAPIPENIVFSKEWYETGLMNEVEVEGRGNAYVPSKLEQMERGIPVDRARLFQKALSRGVNEWNIVEGYHILPLSENLFAIQELSSNDRGDYFRYRLFNAEGESLHRGFILGDNDSPEEPNPSWSIDSNGVLSSSLFIENRRLDERLENLAISTGKILSTEELAEIAPHEDAAELELQDRQAIDWFASLPYSAMQLVFDSRFLQTVGELINEKGGDTLRDWDRAQDDICTNLNGVWFEGQTEQDAMQTYCDLFRSLPLSIQMAMFDTANEKGLSEEQGGLSLRQMVSSSYDVTMVGVGKHTIEQVLSMIPPDTDCVYVVNRRKRYNHDRNLNRERFTRILFDAGISEVYAYPDWDKDVYSTVSDITKDIDAGKRVVCIYEESSPQYGKTSITLGQELARRNYSVAWNIIYKDGKVNTISHEQAILSRVHHARILSGKVHQIEFELDAKGNPTGKFKVGEGVTLALPKHRDNRIIEYNSTRRPSYNGKTREPIYSGKSYYENMQEMVRRAELVFVVGPDLDNNPFLRSAITKAGKKAIAIKVQADPSLLRDPDYARKLMAEHWANIQANTMWREENRELFEAGAQKIAIIGTDEMKMLYENYSLEAQQRSYDERNLRDSEGNDFLFALSDDDVIVQRNTNTTSPEDDINDSVRPTGVTTEVEKVFAQNLYQAFLENKSMKELNEEYERKGLPLPFDDWKVEREQRILTQGALDARIIRRHGAVLSAQVFKGDGTPSIPLENYDLYLQRELDDNVMAKRVSFYEWKVKNLKDVNTMHLFAGHNDDSIRRYAEMLTGEIKQAEVFRHILEPFVGDQEQIADMDAGNLYVVLNGIIPSLSRNDLLSVVNQMASFTQFERMGFEEKYHVLNQMQYLQDVDLVGNLDEGNAPVESPAFDQTLTDVFMTLTQDEQGEVLRRMQVASCFGLAQPAAIQKDGEAQKIVMDARYPNMEKTGSYVIDTLPASARIQIFSSKGIGKQSWSTFHGYEGNVFGVRVLNVHDDVYAIQYRRVSPDKVDFVYGLYNKQGESLIDGFIQGLENDSFEFPMPDWNLQPLNESIEEIMPTYDHVKRDQGFGQIVSNGAPGLNKSFLLGAQAEGIPYLPIFAREFYVATSFSQNGAMVNIPVMAGKDEYCKTGYIEGRNGRPSFIQVTPNDFTAYLTNEYKLYREPNVPVRVTEDTISKSIASFHEKEAAVLEPDSPNLRNGLTPAQVLTLRHMGLSNGEVLQIIRMAESVGKPVKGAIGLVELINRSAVRDYVSNGILSEETAVEGYYKTASNVIEESLCSGEQFITFQEDNYPATLKAWDGYTMKEEPAIPSKKKDAPRKEESPSFLVFKGDISLLDEPTVFVTGSSSSPTSEAIGAARMAGGRLAENGIAVVAVLRSGTDMHAIRAALDRGGRVVLVSPRALDDPKDEAIIQEVISKGGCVISEVMPGERITDAREKAIESILGSDPDVYTRDSQKEKVIDMTSSGFFVNENTIRAKHLATVLGKHLMVIETKEMGDNLDRSVIDLSSDAINGISTFSFPPIDGAVSYKHAGNETLVRDFGASVIRTDGEGLNEVIRRAQSVSANWLQAEAERHEEDMTAEIIFGGGEKGKLSTVNFEVVRQGTKQIFITDTDYIKDAVRSCYGQDVAFASSREEALNILHGRPMTYNGEDVDTFHGWEGIQFQGDIPYVSKLIYHEDFIYSPSNAPAAVFGSKSTDGLRKMHYSFLHETVIPAAEKVIRSFNESNGFAGNPDAMRFSQGFYPVVHPSGVDIYVGAGEQATDDICIAKVFIDSDGLIRFWNNDRNLNLDTVQRARDKVFVLPGIPRSEYTDDIISALTYNLVEFCMYSSRAEREEAALADREKEAEISNTEEAGFRVRDVEDNIDRASEGITDSIGRTIAAPLPGQEPLEKAPIILAINGEIASLEQRLKEISINENINANRINRLKSNVAQLGSDEGSTLIEYEELVTETSLGLMSLKSLRNELVSKIVALEKAKQDIILAKNVSFADYKFRNGKDFEDSPALEGKLVRLFESLSPDEQDNLLDSSRLFQKEDFTVSMFNRLSKTSRIALLVFVAEEMASGRTEFSMKEKEAFEGFYDFKKKRPYPVKNVSMKEARSENVFRSLSTEHQRAFMLSYMKEQGLEYGRNYFDNLDLDTKKVIISFINNDRLAYSENTLNQFDEIPKQTGLSVDGRFYAISMKTYTPQQLAEAKKEIDEQSKQLTENQSMFNELIASIENPDRLFTAEERQAIQRKGLERKLKNKVAAEGEIIQFEDEIIVNGHREKTTTGALPTGVGIAKRANHYAYVRGGNIISDWFTSMKHMPNSQRMLVQTASGKYNVINSKGVKVLQEDMDEIRMDSERISAVRKGDKWNHVNFKLGGKLVCEDWAEEVHDFHEGRAAIMAGEEEGENKGKWAFIDINGDLTSDWFDSIEADYSDGEALVRDGDKMYTIDPNGMILSTKDVEKASEESEEIYNGNEEQPSELISDENGIENDGPEM